MKRKSLSIITGGVAVAALAFAACGGDDDNTCADGGVCVKADASAGTRLDSGTLPPPAYLPASGTYTVQEMAVGGVDGCNRKPGDAVGKAVIPVTSNAITNAFAVGNPQGTPPIASLGEGIATGVSFNITRMNTYGPGVDGSPCTYTAKITSTVSLNDPTGKTFGLQVTEQRSNITSCDFGLPAGTTECASTYSWRLGL